jgi:hypothetical protein
MAGFQTTTVVISGADMPHIVQRFLLTSERYLFNPLLLRFVEPSIHAREAT